MPQDGMAGWWMSCNLVPDILDRVGGLVLQPDVVGLLEVQPAGMFLVSLTRLSLSASFHRRPARIDTFFLRSPVTTQQLPVICPLLCLCSITAVRAGVSASIRFQFFFRRVLTAELAVAEIFSLPSRSELKFSRPRNRGFSIWGVWIVAQWETSETKAHYRWPPLGWSGVSSHQVLVPFSRDSPEQDPQFGVIKLL